MFANWTMGLSPQNEWMQNEWWVSSTVPTIDSGTVQGYEWICFSGTELLSPPPECKLQNSPLIVTKVFTCEYVRKAVVNRVCVWPLPKDIVGQTDKTKLEIRMSNICNVIIWLVECWFSKLFTWIVLCSCKYIYMCVLIYIIHHSKPWHFLLAQNYLFTTMMISWSITSASYFS